MSNDTLITAGDIPPADDPTTGQLVNGSDSPSAADNAPSNEGQPQSPVDSDVGTGDSKTDTAPDKYEFTAPEGSEFDPGVIEAFSSAARELNLTQDQAQSILDKVAPVIQSQQESRIAQVQAEWLESARVDSEFGGQNLEQNMAVAKKAMDAFATPALRDLLNSSGLGNHPEVIRVFYRAGKVISEDVFVSRSQGVGDQRDARNHYAASNMNP